MASYLLCYRSSLFCFVSVCKHLHDHRDILWNQLVCYNILKYQFAAFHPISQLEITCSVLFLVSFRQLFVCVSQNLIDQQTRFKIYFHKSCQSEIYCNFFTSVRFFIRWRELGSHFDIKQMIKLSSNHHFTLTYQVFCGCGCFNRFSSLNILFLRQYTFSMMVILLNLNVFFNKNLILVLSCKYEIHSKRLLYGRMLTHFKIIHTCYFIYLTLFIYKTIIIIFKSF